MKHSFINLLRQPDSILFQYEDSGIRFEEADSREEQNACVEYRVEENAGCIILYPSQRPIKRIKLRWRGDMSDCFILTGDALERIYDSSTAAWTGMIPQRMLPWYFQVYDGEKLNCFGVKTGADAICCFQCDDSGITLWVDVRNGGGGVCLKEPLLAAKVVCREGDPAETPFNASKAFCAQMCDAPVLPKQPIFGVNNWYWAYGKLNHNIVMSETDQLMDMCRDAVHSPYMVIDAGWQKGWYRTRENIVGNAGPWDQLGAGFSSMEETAGRITEKGAKPGLWFRPLCTSVQVPAEWEGPRQMNQRGIVLDPSHPDVLELVGRDTARIAKWGYELIKHDFTTIDTLSFHWEEDGNWHYYDRTITNATMLKRLYQTIQQAAGEAEVLGCNTVNHLVAGIHAAQRSSEDTSGRYFEMTRRNGIASFIRLPQNQNFFAIDPDCAAFTERVPIKENLDFLEASAITGCITLASVTPGILKGNDLSRIRDIYRIASKGGIGAVPADWLGHNVCSRFETPDGQKFSYDWYQYYDGVRNFLSGLN